MQVRFQLILRGVLELGWPLQFSQMEAKGLDLCILIAVSRWWWADSPHEVEPWARQFSVAKASASVECSCEPSVTGSWMRPLSEKDLTEHHRARARL